MKRLWLALLAALATPVPAQAEWLEASSDHFVIYADDKPAEIQQFSQQLERFHAALAVLLESREPPPSPSNRVTVFVVKNERAVRKLAGDSARYVYAFYQPRAGASIAIVPQVDVKSGQLDFSMIALLHEYAHHFQLSTARFPWPRWFAEGSAEFFSSAKFDRDGTVTIGLAAMHRANELYRAPDVTVADLLDPESYEKKPRKGYDAYYGKSWLLYHYLTISPDRPGQFERYLRLMQAGQSSVEAARSSFGDFDRLEKDLGNYLNKRTITSIQINPAALQPGPVAIRTLSAGEAAMMPIRVRSRRGVTREQALELLPEARAIAARFPKDAAVLAALAEAEHDAGNDDPAVAAADAALAIDPRQVNAYVQKGLALFRKAESAEDKARAYRAARAPFLALNAIENDHPLPLVYYYLAYRKQGTKPPDNAAQALERASQLAPFDLSLRFTVAMQQIADKQIDKAIDNLTPLAYNPHGGQRAEGARRLLERLKSGSAPGMLEVDALTAEMPGLAQEPEPADPASDDDGKAEPGKSAR